jgi:hypothetical protein
VAERANPRTLLATLPTGAFPGVDTTDLYEFLEAHATEVGAGHAPEEISPRMPLRHPSSG